MKTKKIISLILVIVMCLSLVVMPASADSKAAKESEYPFVFVHGLMGWGATDDMYGITPYWGMTSCNILDYLNGMGYECYAAKVGPLSSAWDRACELYAQLTGTTVDYGIAHSQEKGHERFGRSYDDPMFEGWNAEKKINLVGHSFGGATIRMFLEILTNGAEEEVEAAKKAGTEVSEFFTGGKGDWVYSLTALSAPHNGSTYTECGGTLLDLLVELVYNFDASLGINEKLKLIDPQLEHFGLELKDGESMIHYLTRVLGSEKFLSHNDNALYDLGVDNAMAINDKIDMQDGVYYFSVYGISTHKSLLGSKQLPNIDMMPVLSPFAAKLGSYSGVYTKGGFYIDDSWLPNDGLVNEASAQYPFKSDGTADSYKIWTAKTGKFEVGVWNVMPAEPYDHLSIAGGLFSNNAENVKAVFLNIVQNVVSTYTEAGAPVSPAKINLVFKLADIWQQLFSTMGKYISYFFNNLF